MEGTKRYAGTVLGGLRVCVTENEVSCREGVGGGVTSGRYILLWISGFISFLKVKVGRGMMRSVFGKSALLQH